MGDKSIMQMADDILGGALTNPPKMNEAKQQCVEEELPEVSPEQHDVLMSHILGEGKAADAAKKVARGVKKAGKVAKRLVTPLTDEEADAAGVPRRGERYRGPRKPNLQRDHMEHLSKDQIEILQQAKDILGEMTGVGSIGVNMAGGEKQSSHHPAMQVKLPGDKDQAKQIKAASTPPVYKAEAAKGPSQPANTKKRVIVKRKSAQSKDDETQTRVHNDMRAMYHESFDSFVDGILLKENAKKGYAGDVSVADFGRKGPASDTFGGGGVKTQGTGPKVQLTSNQLMTANKKAKAKGQDKGENAFGNASSHSRKHPQNPYAGSK